jgi:hypothetical protein
MFHQVNEARTKKEKSIKNNLLGNSRFKIISKKARNPLNSSLELLSSCLFLLPSYLGLYLFSTPVAAHKVEIAGDVAGTWHVEPNHNPKAGESARAWVALTRKGGQILPLQQASCQMAVYSQPRKQGDSPVLQPSIKAVSVEKYENIPGADIVFPNTGIYQLELSCKPKTEGSFKAFQMKYDVTVATAATPTKQLAQSETSASNNTNSADDQERDISLLIIVPVILGLGTSAVFLWRRIQN